jgi:hypothetical protein
MNYKSYITAIPSIENELSTKNNSLLYILNDGTNKKIYGYEFDLFVENYHSISSNPFDPTNGSYQEDTSLDYVNITPVKDTLDNEIGNGYNIEKILIKNKDGIWIDFLAAKTYVETNHLTNSFPNNDGELTKTLQQFIETVYNANTDYPIDINISGLSLDQRLETILAVGKYMNAIDPNEIDDDGHVIIGNINNYFSYDDHQQGIKQKVVKKYDGMITGDLLSCDIVNSSGGTITNLSSVTANDIQFKVTFDNENVDLTNMLFFYKGKKYTISQSTITSLNTENSIFMFNTLEIEPKQDIIDTSTKPNTTLENGLHFYNNQIGKKIEQLGSNLLDVSDLSQYTDSYDGFVGSKIKINDTLRNTINNEILVFYKGELVDSHVIEQSDGTKHLFINKPIYNSNDVAKITIVQYVKDESDFSTYLNVKTYHDIDKDMSSPGSELVFKNFRNDLDFINRCELFIDGVKTNMTIKGNSSILISSTEFLNLSTVDDLNNYINNHDIRLVSITNTKYYAYEPSFSGLQVDNKDYQTSFVFECEEVEDLYNIYAYLTPANYGYLNFDLTNMTSSTSDINATTEFYPFYVIRNNEKVVPVRLRDTATPSNGADGNNGSSITISFSTSSIMHKISNEDALIPNQLGSFVLNWIQSYTTPVINNSVISYPSNTTYPDMTLDPVSGSVVNINNTADAIIINFDGGCRNLKADPSKINVINTVDSSEVTTLAKEFINDTQFKITFDWNKLDQYVSDTLDININSQAFYDADTSNDPQVYMSDDITYSINIQEVAFTPINLLNLWLVKNDGVEVPLTNDMVDAPFKLSGIKVEINDIEYFILNDKTAIQFQKISGGSTLIQDIIDTNNITETKSTNGYLIDIPFNNEEILSLNNEYRFVISQDFIHNFDEAMPNPTYTYSFTTVIEDNTTMDFFAYVQGGGAYEYGGYYRDDDRNAYAINLNTLKGSVNEINSDTIENCVLDNEVGNAPKFIVEFAKWVHANNDESGIFLSPDGDLDDETNIDKMVLKEYLWKIFKGDSWPMDEEHNYTDPLMAFRNNADWLDSDNNNFFVSSETTEPLFGTLTWNEDISMKLDSECGSYALDIKNKIIDKLNDSKIAIYVSRDYHLNQHLTASSDVSLFTKDDIKWRLLGNSPFVLTTSEVKMRTTYYTWSYTSDVDLTPYYTRLDGGSTTTDPVPSPDNVTRGVTFTYGTLSNDIELRVRQDCSGYAYVVNSISDPNDLGKIYFDNLPTTNWLDVRFKLKWDDTFDLTSDSSYIKKDTNFKFDINDRLFNGYSNLYAAGTGSN